MGLIFCEPHFFTQNVKTNVFTHIIHYFSSQWDLAVDDDNNEVDIVDNEVHNVDNEVNYDEDVCNLNKLLGFIFFCEENLLSCFS